MCEIVKPFVWKQQEYHVLFQSNKQLSNIKYGNSCLSDCSSPPLIVVGISGSIIGNPPYEANETITYTCVTNYTIEGTAENKCTGPPDFNWTVTGSDLPSCLKSKKNLNYAIFLQNELRFPGIVSGDWPLKLISRFVVIKQV